MVDFLDGREEGTSVRSVNDFEEWQRERGVG